MIDASSLFPLLAAGSADQFPLLTTIAAGFTAAWVCGLLTQSIKLSPIVGYLLGGVIIGPHTPGFVADEKLATELAEIGVILLMFGVGLHFHLKDLLAVRKIAIPGALCEITFITSLGLLLALWVGWPIKAGLVIGVAMSVASTVVLTRVLMDNGVLDSPHGHVAIGWLIFEDILTVIVLILIPVLATMQLGGEAATSLTPATEAAAAGAAAGGTSILEALISAFLRLGALIGLMLVVGYKAIPWVLVRVARLRSRELFTLTVLVFAIAIATASATIFGVSVALGAFLAGMAVGQSPVSQQAGADALPMRDAFAVLFFVSVGMLFDPVFLVEQPLLVLAALAIVLIGKPLAALTIIGILGHSSRTALTVALGLAEIGEFSFIVAKLGVEQGIVPQAGLSMLVACALLSITINPALFRLVPKLDAMIARYPRLHRWMNRRSQKMLEEANRTAALKIVEMRKDLAIVVGYGPVGRTVDRLLRSKGMETVVIDMNMDTVSELKREGRLAIFGDATNGVILEQAGVQRATHLLVTLPHSENRGPMISAARHHNQNLRILVRARYLREKDFLCHVGADDAIIEESEAAIALARLTLQKLGESDSIIEAEEDRIRDEFEGTDEDEESVKKSLGG